MDSQVIRSVVVGVLAFLLGAQSAVAQVPLFAFRTVDGSSPPSITSIDVTPGSNVQLTMSLVNPFFFPIVSFEARPEFGNDAYFENFSFSQVAPWTPGILPLSGRTSPGVSGISRTGTLSWSIPSDAPLGSTTLRVVADPNIYPDTGAQYADGGRRIGTSPYLTVNIVPSPGAASMLALAGLLAARRRR